MLIGRSTCKIFKSNIVYHLLLILAFYNKCILVTGATGFIGFHLCKRLIECGDNVLGVDNLSNYYDVNLKIDRLKQLTEMKNFRFLKTDISEKEAMENLFSAQKFDTVVNLAAQTGVRYSLVNPHWKNEEPNPATSFAPYRLYNIGNNNPVDLMECIEILENCLNKKAEKNFLPIQPGDVPVTNADVDDLMADLNFKPNIPIKVGIKKFVAWYKEYYKV